MTPDSNPVKRAVVLALLLACVVLLVAACGRTDAIVGTWDCDAPIGTQTFSFYDDSSFVMKVQVWFVKGSVAGKWERSGKRLDLAIEAAPSELQMKPGTVDQLEIITLNQSVFVWKDRAGKATTCSRQQPASGG